MRVLSSFTSMYTGIFFSMTIASSGAIVGSSGSSIMSMISLQASFVISHSKHWYVAHDLVMLNVIGILTENDCRSFSVQNWPCSSDRARMSLDDMIKRIRRVVLFL